jgi:hypothetical protein
MSGQTWLVVNDISNIDFTAVLLLVWCDHTPLQRVLCNSKVLNQAAQTSSSSPAGRRKKIGRTRLSHRSGQIGKIFDATSKIQTKLAPRRQNLSGQDQPSAEQTFYWIIRGPLVSDFHGGQSC